MSLGNILDRPAVTSFGVNERTCPVQSFGLGAQFLRIEPVIRESSSPYGLQARAHAETRSTERNADRRSHYLQPVVKTSQKSPSRTIIASLNRNDSLRQNRLNRFNDVTTQEDSWREGKSLQSDPRRAPKSCAPVITGVSKHRQQNAS